MKKFIFIILLVAFNLVTAQQTATDTELKVVPMERMKQETDIVDNNRCFQILLREENLRLKYIKTETDKNIPATRMLKALQIQFYIEGCSEKDKADFKEFQKIRY